MKLKLNNTNDFNQMIMKVMNTIKMPVVNLMSKAINLYLNETTNFILRQIPSPIPLSNGFYVNLNFLKRPDITEDISHQVINGTFMYKDMPLVNESYTFFPIPEYFSENGKPF